MTLKAKRRFLIACLTPFFCIFSATLIKTNAVFALDGMINHTHVDILANLNFDEKDVNITQAECDMESLLEDGSKPLRHDGPFPWDAPTESLINLIIAIGGVVGTVLTLFIYDLMNGRFIFAICLMFAGLINILTPGFAMEGGFVPVVIFRFFTGLYTGMLYPAIPALLQNWFLHTELCRTNVLVFLGIDTGRIFFFLSGYVINTPSLGWQFLFYLPGVFCLVLGFFYICLVTDDPFVNAFITLEEKQAIAANQHRTLNVRRRRSKRLNTLSVKLKRYKKHLHLLKRDGRIKKVPYKAILSDAHFILATIQYTASSWLSPVRTLMMKKYVQEAHGYTVSEAAILVTLPTNISQIVFGWITGWLGDKATYRNANVRLVRCLASFVCILAALPYVLLPFLPCWLVNYRATVVIIQIVGSIRTAGNLAGYSSFRDLTPNYTRHLFGLASIPAATIPNVAVPLFMGWFHTETRTQWKNNFVTNFVIVVTGQLLYLVFMRHERAAWDPQDSDEEEEEDDPDTISGHEETPECFNVAEVPYGASVYDASSLQRGAKPTP